MNIFVINAGSSSLKYQLIDTKKDQLLCKGLVDRIGVKGSGALSAVSYKYFKDGDWKEVSEDTLVKNHEDALKIVLDKMVSKSVGVIKSRDEISAIGHRVVHGGEFFSDSVIIDKKVLDKVKECIPLGPLHNPANISGIEACDDLFPGKKQVAVFDTAFHQTMPPEAYFYAIPRNLYDMYKIRKYGFHGTSYRFISLKLSEIYPSAKKVIVCHLGNGSSICAIRNGHSIDTSMGFTPLEGLVMGTRSGDLDPAVVAFIARNEKLSADDVEKMLNKESGLMGISKISSDMRDLWAEDKKGNKIAKTTIDLFSYRIRKYIGAYAAALGGVDAIVFTGGIGQNAFYVRERALHGLEYLGVDIDMEKNTHNDAVITKDNSKVKVFVLETNEELMIAKDTERLCK